MKRLTIIFACIATLAGCRGVDPVEEQPRLLRVSPIITKASDVDFDDGDRIGLTVLKEGSVYSENALLTCSGGVFSGDLYWYLEPESEASLYAYYPYDASGVPESFTVAADQSAGISSSDLIAGTKSGVYPTKNVVDMVFRHQLTKIVVTICNASGSDISSVVLGGSVPTARVDVAAGTVKVDTGAPSCDIRACMVKKDTLWKAIVVPQTVSFDFKVTLSSGKILVQKLKELDIQQSFQYAVSAVVYDDHVRIVTSGQIQDWLEGGDIPGGDEPGPQPEFEEHLEDGYFIYHDERYSVAKMADGKWWMTSNMRYLPDGVTPCSDLQNVTAGVYCPVTVNEGHTGAVFSSDAALAAENGYLYQTETALGLEVGTIRTEEDARALEGARGICPEGWHIPTGDDIVHLVGKIAQYKYNEGESAESGAYYDVSIGNASIEKLNRDSFNASAWGAVSILDNVRTSATLMGWLKSSPDRISSGYVCGSSFASATAVDSSDPSLGYKNFQFWAMMPMASNGTFNGAKLSYRIGATVRCVRDSQ